MAALAPLLPHAELSAVVQRDAVDELPRRVRPHLRPVVAGVARAGLGMLPVAGADLVHSLDVDLPLVARAARVATVHDMSVFDVPWASSRLRATGERQLVRAALRGADVLVAVSEFTAERVEAACGRRCVITHLAPAPWATPPSAGEVRRVRAAHRLPARFVLQVGSVEPRKDVALVAAAAHELGVACVLAGAGSTGPDAPAGVQGLGYVEVGDLPGLYAAATVVAYASTYEGFGLPPVEAMACGAAVVASRVGALAQVVGDGAVLVGRHHLDDWVAALRPLLADADERSQLGARASAAVATLSWAETARGTVAVYRDAGAHV
jgi:glycosyltransferase involved in cell wall biosynthesis